MEDNHIKNGAHHCSHLMHKGANNETFAERLRRYARDKHKLTQAQLANKAGISLATVQNYEYGSKPKSELIIAISQALKCSIDWLLTGIGPEDISEKTTGVAETPTSSSRSSPGGVSSDYIPEEEDAFSRRKDSTGFGRAAEMLAEIFHSGDATLISAITANLEAFSSTVRARREVEKTSKENVGLKAENIKLKQDLAACDSKNNGTESF